MALGWIKLPSGYIRAQDHFAKPEVLVEIAQAAHGFANEGRKYHPQDEEPEDAFSRWFLGLLKASDRLEGLLNPERLSFQHPDLRGHFSGPMDRSNALSSIRTSLDATLKWLGKTNLCTIRPSSDAEFKGHEWQEVAIPFPQTLTQPKARWWDVATLAGDDLVKLVADAHKADTSYLGINLELAEREATRIVNGNELGPVEFGKKSKPWELFKTLVEAGNDGIHRRELVDRFAAIDLLIDLNWLEVAEIPTGGRTRTEHKINPRVSQITSGSNGSTQEGHFPDS